MHSLMKLEDLKLSDNWKGCQTHNETSAEAASTTSADLAQAEIPATTTRPDTEPDL